MCAHMEEAVLRELYKLVLNGCFYIQHRSGLQINRVPSQYTILDGVRKGIQELVLACKLVELESHGLGGSEYKAYFPATGVCAWCIFDLEGHIPVALFAVPGEVASMPSIVLALHHSVQVVYSVAALCRTEKVSGEYTLGRHKAVAHSCKLLSKLHC